VLHPVVLTEEIPEVIGPLAKTVVDTTVVQPLVPSVTVKVYVIVVAGQHTGFEMVGELKNELEVQLYVYPAVGEFPINTVAPEQIL